MKNQSPKTDKKTYIFRCELNNYSFLSSLHGVSMSLAINLLIKQAREKGPEIIYSLLKDKK